jgi:DNA ligase D-like protein (predicted 3'-phosphoesterase)
MKFPVVTDFVIHEHRAKKAGLHYDLRIRFGDSLKDWAFRKVIPTEPNIKRLGIEQEDHHPSWLDFEGQIQDGYGAGELRIWDKGQIEILQVVEDTKIIFNCKGQKVLGKYLLIKSAKLGGWLLWKDK